MKSFQQIQEILPPLRANIKRIYLLGSTGAGKTSIVSHIIGTSALGFPITTEQRLRQRNMSLNVICLLRLFLFLSKKRMF